MTMGNYRNLEERKSLEYRPSVSSEFLEFHIVIVYFNHHYIFLSIIMKYSVIKLVHK